MFARVIGCLILAVVVTRFWKGTRVATVTGQDVPATATATIRDADFEQQLARFRAQNRSGSEPIPVTVPRETEENLPPAEPGLLPLDSADQQIGDDSLDVTVFEPYATDGTQVAELPEWTSQTGESEGLPQVITTGPHPTPIGATADAYTRLARLLSKKLVREHPEAAGWTPQFSDMYRIGVVGRRANQQNEVTVGRFTEPVFQEFVEVVPPADLDAHLFNLWRADTVNSRLLMVGGAMGLLTLMFGSLAGYFRIDEATRGKYRRQLRWVTAALWVAAGSALAFVA